MSTVTEYAARIHDLQRWCDEESAARRAAETDRDKWQAIAQKAVAEEGATRARLTDRIEKLTADLAEANEANAELNV